MATHTHCSNFFTVLGILCHRYIRSFIFITAICVLNIKGQECPGRCRSCSSGVADCTRRSLTAPPKSYPPDTREIHLQGNNIRILGSRTFRRQQTAEILKIADNKITALRNDAFRTFPNLMSMELTGNRISRIYPRALSGMHRLRSLSLNRNRIRRVGTIFQGTINLRQLNLASNRITALQENDLSPLSRIHYLDLRDNQISRIHPRAFKNLNNLRYLFLNNNPISSALDLEFGSSVLQLVDISNCRLPQVPQTLPGSVSDLRLGKNSIMQINHTDFQNINDLQMLALNENQLHFLADGTFTHLTKLKEIWLRSNNLGYLPRDIPPNVEKLYIDSNRIQEMEPGLFHSESMMGFFSAENNQLRRINPDTFNGMQHLHTINLQGNQLQSLETRTFVNLPSLHSLLLSNNPLRIMAPGTFQNLPNMTNLHLSYLTPETMDIQDNFLVQMPRLQTLQIMASPGMGHAIIDMLDRLSGRNLVVLPFLISLDLSYNNLLSVSPRIRDIFPNARSVLLDGNPFHCSQNLRWLPEWMRSTNITFHRSEDLMCQTPESLRGRQLLSLSNQEWVAEGVVEEANSDQPLGRQRQKRRHDESTYKHVHGNSDNQEVGRPRHQPQNVQRNDNKADKSHSRPSTESSSTDIRQTKPSTQVERALALRTQRQERRRKMRTRSGSRSRKGGKRRNRRRRRRKGRKNNKRKGNRRNRNKINVENK